MAAPTQTAVIVPVGRAESVVQQHRQRLDVAASWGVPAHVTIVYPFVPPAEVTGHVIARLASAVSRTASFECVFGACDWFGDEVLWLAPDPTKPFRDLTAAVVEQFPDHKPYGGLHDVIVPHLTVGESARGSLTELKAAEADVLTGLPFTAHIDHVLLIAGSDQRDSWRTVAVLPLGGCGS